MGNFETNTRKIVARLMRESWTSEHGREHDAAGCAHRGPSSPRAIAWRCAPDRQIGEVVEASAAKQES